jgi:hypothetical protein
MTEISTNIVSQANSSETNAVTVSTNRSSMTAL